jgi:hypothetical protein
MESNLTLHLRLFNDKVKLMNQSNSKGLTLTAQEARNIHADLFDLLNHCATLSQAVNAQKKDETVINLQMDGGGFK